ncbi:hypothetical protein SAMN04487770_102173 [Butyrivibrio sp. ob235]|uniref:hypothetical protein n=1 Tax=Butyrivibrio sp. ob235 TaxID=1761780 RepID=UPI0008AF4B37|nr:hypothetical protein [Butyrivibrio sp. ob235]SEK64982.1 hypothetical protein SAMN04487770_102173 [Butyrivibrio sp. ob235]
MKNRVVRILSVLGVALCLVVLLYVPNYMEMYYTADHPYYNPSTGEIIVVQIECPAEQEQAKIAEMNAKYAAMGYTVAIDPALYTEAWVAAGPGGNDYDKLREIAEARGVIPSGAKTAAEATATESQKQEEPVAEQPQTEETQPEEVKEETKVETQPEKEYSHGVYDEINKDALDAFDHFLYDGIADSCYIQVKNSAENKTMPAWEIERTATGKENGEIQFVDDNGNIVYSVIFPQVETDEDIELGIDIAAEDNIMVVSPVSQKNSFTDLGYTLWIKVPMGKDEKYAEFNLYTKSSKAGKDYEEFMKATADENGNVILPINILQNYYISKDLLVKTEEAKEVAEESVEESVSEPVEEVEPVKEEVKAPVEAMPVEKQVESAANDNLKWVICGIIACAGIVAGILIYKKKSK